MALALITLSSSTCEIKYFFLFVSLDHVEMEEDGDRVGVFAVQLPASVCIHSAHTQLGNN